MPLDITKEVSPRKMYKKSCQKPRALIPAKKLPDKSHFLPPLRSVLSKMINGNPLDSIFHGNVLKM